MAEHVTLLPPNATPLELLFSEVDDDFVNLIDDFNLVPVGDAATPPQFMPFLVWQYGLGELSPYLPNLYDLIDQGIRWQRIRGTPAAISLGLSWLGYSMAALEEAQARRRLWNRFQIQLDRVRDADYPDLPRIDGIVALSPPLRSRFARGYRGYDVRACEASYQRFSGSMFSDSSGTYLPNVGAKWSFGRLYEFDHSLTQSELTSLGAWIPPIGGDGRWIVANTLWTAANYQWSLPAAEARVAAIVGALSAFSVWVRFTDTAGQTIGFRRAVTHPVAPSNGGEYLIQIARWTTYTTSPTAFLVQALTGFGDGAGSAAAHVSVVWGGTVDPSIKPGQQWLEPDQLTGGVEILSTAVSIPFGLTVRERIRFLLRF